MTIDSNKLIKVQDLLDLSNINKLKSALAVIQKVQNNIAALQENDSSNKRSILKVGTTLTVAILKKVESGKLPTDFSVEDWEDIVDHVTEYGVEADETKYSAYVFMLYAWFIEGSVAQISYKLSNEKQAAILSLAEQIKARTVQLGDEEISEVDYIEGCLWICLEAMIKLLSGTIDSAIGFDKNQVVEATAVLGMEYARYVLYKKEHELLTEYLDNQKKFDAELTAEYEEFIKELNEQTAQFEILIDKAFDQNFGELLINSVNLARAAGVDESEILKTTEDIDAFFM